MNHEETKRHWAALRSIIVFRYLADDALEEIAEASELVSFAEDARIVAEGAMDTHLYAVLQGSVNVFVDAPGESKRVFICGLGQGDVFGEAGIFLQTPRTADVVAGAKATLLRIERDRFFEFIHRRPAAGIKILYIMIYSLLRKLRDANQELAFERRSTLGQEDIDAIVEGALKKI